MGHADACLLSIRYSRFNGSITGYCYMLERKGNAPPAGNAVRAFGLQERAKGRGSASLAKIDDPMGVTGDACQRSGDRTRSMHQMGKRPSLAAKAPPRRLPASSTSAGGVLKQWHDTGLSRLHRSVRNDRCTSCCQCEPTEWRGLDLSDHGDCKLTEARHGRKRRSLA